MTVLAYITTLIASYHRAVDELETLRRSTSTRLVVQRDYLDEDGDERTFTAAYDLTVNMRLLLENDFLSRVVELRREIERLTSIVITSRVPGDN